MKAKKLLKSITEVFKKPKILGYAIQNSTTDVMARENSPHGYLEKDIPMLVDLGFLRKKPKKPKNAAKNATKPENANAKDHFAEYEQVIKKREGDKEVPFTPEDILAFFVHLTTPNVDKFPMPLLMRRLLEEKRCQLREAMHSMGTSPAARSYEDYLVAEINATLRQDEEYGATRVECPDEKEPLTGPVEAVVGDAHAVIASIDAQEAVAAETIASLQTELDAVKDRNAIREAEKTALQKKLEEAEGRVENLQHAKEELEAAKKKVEEERDALKAKSEAKTDESPSVSLEEEIEALEKAMEKLDETVLEMQDTLHTQQTTVENMSITEPISASQEPQQSPKKQPKNTREFKRVSNNARNNVGNEGIIPHPPDIPEEAPLPSVNLTLATEEPLSSLSAPSEPAAISELPGRRNRNIQSHDNVVQRVVQSTPALSELGKVSIPAEQPSSPAQRTRYMASVPPSEIAGPMPAPILQSKTRTNRVSPPPLPARSSPKTPPSSTLPSQSSLPFSPSPRRLRNIQPTAILQPQPQPQPQRTPGGPTSSLLNSGVRTTTLLPFYLPNASAHTNAHLEDEMDEDLLEIPELRQSPKKSITTSPETILEEPNFANQLRNNNTTKASARVVTPIPQNIVGPNISRLLKSQIPPATLPFQQSASRPVTRPQTATSNPKDTENQEAFLNNVFIYLLKNKKVHDKDIRKQVNFKKRLSTLIDIVYDPNPAERTEFEYELQNDMVTELKEEVPQLVSFVNSMGIVASNNPFRDGYDFSDGQKVSQDLQVIFERMNEIGSRTPTFRGGAKTRKCRKQKLRKTYRRRM